MLVTFWPGTLSPHPENMIDVPDDPAERRELAYRLGIHPILFERTLL